MSDVSLEQDRRAATAADVAALRAEMAAGFSRTDAANARTDAAIGRVERRLDAVESSMKPYSEHIATAAVLGEVHTAAYAEVVKRQDRTERDVDGQDLRLDALEKKWVRFEAYGTILRATFGVSVIGAIIAIVSLLNMIVTFGR